MFLQILSGIAGRSVALGWRFFYPANFFLNCTMGAGALVQQHKIREVRGQRELLVTTLRDRGGVDTLLNALDADRVQCGTEPGAIATRYFAGAGAALQGIEQRLAALIRLRFNQPLP